MDDHGAIVVGAGHNGLICAAYLARGGIDTLLLEARDDVGGCASTVDALGARVNICNCDHATVRSTPIMEELDLAAHGLRYLDIDPAQWMHTYGDGPAWPAFRDLGRTLDALAATHPQEVDAYRRYAKVAVPLARLLLDLALVPPTPGRIAGRVARHHGEGLGTLLRWSRRSAGSVLRSYFSTAALQAPAFAQGPAVWGVAPSTPRTGVGALAYALRHVVSIGRPVGGSGRLPDAVLGSFRANGGTVQCASRVSAILCEGERVRAIRLTDGTEITARIVVVACDPSVALLQWLEDPPAGAQSMLDRWRAQPVHEGYESKIDAVVDRLPSYRNIDPDLAARLGVDPLDATSVIAPDLDGFEEAHRLLAAGRIAERPMLLVNLPSVRDPTLRLPDGGHVLSLEVMFTPYRLEGGWPGSPEPERWLRLYGELLEPGFLDGMRDWRVMTPPRYEQEFFLPRGYATSYGGGPVAALLGRDKELTRYETPVHGLFLTGAATFPGAGVWGASGRNTAHVILASRP